MKLQERPVRMMDAEHRSEFEIWNCNLLQFSKDVAANSLKLFGFQMVRFVQMVFVFV